MSHDLGPPLRFGGGANLPATSPARRGSHVAGLAAPLLPATDRPFRDAEGAGGLRSCQPGVPGPQQAVANVGRVLVHPPSIAPRTTPGQPALVTSRVRLRLSVEREFPVPPLALPEHQEHASGSDPRASAAVRLFVARAQATKPGFALTDQNAGAVAAICRRLDGLPLAIELAAARIKVLPPASLLGRLERRLPLLTGGGRDLPTRQHTMRDAIAWSNDLLTAEEQLLFRRLAVFVGGFTLEAAEAVVAGEGSGNAWCLPSTSLDVFEGIASLVDKSLLVQQTDPGGEARYTMLETVREFAGDQLAASGEKDPIRLRHAEFFVEFAEQAEAAFFDPEEMAWLDRCAAELGNFRAVLERSIDGEGDPALGLRLGAALWWFWLQRVSLREGRRWLEQALTQDHTAPAAVRAKALAVAGEIATFQNDYSRALAWLEESLALYRAIADPFGLARAQFFLGDHRQNRGEVEASISPLEEALAGFRALGATAWAGVTLYYLAVSASLMQDYERARALADEALRLCRQAGFATGMAMTFGRLDTQAFKEGHHEAAEHYFREALALRLRLDDRYGMANQLTELAYVAAARRDAERAARLDGAASALRQVTGAEIDAVQRPAYDRFIAGLRDALGHDRFADLWSAGDARTPEQAIAAAREVISNELATASAPSTRAAPPASTGLTPRELDVLRLLAEGRSDREIAEALFIGARTVQTHVANLFAKLGVNARAEAAAVAVRRGLV